MANFAQPVVQIAPTAPIALNVDGTGLNLEVTTGGSGGAVATVNGRTGAVTVASEEMATESLAAGTALINGTQTLLTWTAPADGTFHRFTLVTMLHVLTNETGGAVTLTYTTPDGTVLSGVSVYAANLTSGFNPSTIDRLVQSGSTVTVQQSTALTVGSATFWGQIWGL